MAASLSMGGYAGYLLVAYGITAVVIIGNIVAAHRRFRSTQERLREQLARRAGRPVRAPEGNPAGPAHGREL